MTSGTPAPGSTRVPPVVTRLGLWVFLLALVVYGLTTGGSMATDVMSYEVTKGIVEHGTVAMSTNVFHMDAHRGADGRYYAPYGIGQALYGVPFYAAAQAGQSWTGLRLGRSDAVGKAGFVMGSAVAVALAVWLTFLFAWRLTRNGRAAVTTALAFGFGTLAWPYAKFGFNAPLGMLCLLWGSYGVWVGVRDREASRFGRGWMLAVGGTGLGGALLVKHELALVCLPIGVWIAWESWREARDWRLILQRGVLVGTPVVLAVIVTLAYNVVRFGNPLDTGYLRDETVLLGSFWTGLSGLLVSPGFSLFWYSPLAIAGLLALVIRPKARSGECACTPACDASTCWLFGSQTAILVVFYASLAHWDGERSYGPRYLLPIVPFLLLPLAGWLGTLGSTGRGTVVSRLLRGLLVLSVLVQMPGVLVDFSKVGFSNVVGARTWQERRWTWRSSALMLNTQAAWRAVPVNLAYLTVQEPPPVVPAQGRSEGFSQQFEFSLDFWWLYLYYFGAIPAWVALGVPLVGGLTVGSIGWRLRAALRRAGP